MRLKSILSKPVIVFAFGCVLAGANAAHACTASPEIELGYRQMYNLDFITAHKTFSAWQQAHPDDPMGFVSDAAAYLFSEFNRLHILEFDLFTEDNKFKSRVRLTPDSAAKLAFDHDLDRANQVAQIALAKSPHDHSAMLAQILASGLRGDYVALIENHNLASLSYMKNSRSIAEKLLAEDPECYDAYLAVGAENYLLSLNSAPLRWFLRLTGAQTDKQQGIAKLKLTAEKGKYLGPYARLLLAVAALRDKDMATARTLLQQLALEFPRNDLYAKELARIRNN